MLKLHPLPLVVYRFPNGSKFTASARIGRNIVTQVRKDIKATRIGKTPRDEVLDVLEEAHAKFDLALITSQQVSRTLEEVIWVTNILRASMGGEATTPQDFVPMESPDSDPYESVPSQPAAAVVEMARSVVAAIAAAKAISPDVDFVTLDDTIAFLEEVRAHLENEMADIRIMLEDGNALLEQLTTVAVSMADDTDPVERSARMSLAMKEAKATGRPYDECRSEIEAAVGPALPVREITARFQMVPELENQARFLSPQDMKAAANSYLKAQVAARKRATAKHKAELRSKLAKDLEYVWRKAEKADA